MKKTKEFIIVLLVGTVIGLILHKKENEFTIDEEMIATLVQIDEDLQNDVINYLHIATDKELMISLIIIEKQMSSEIFSEKNSEVIIKQESSEEMELIDQNGKINDDLLIINVKKLIKFQKTLKLYLEFKKINIIKIRENTELSKSI